MGLDWNSLRFNSVDTKKTSGLGAIEKSNIDKSNLNDVRSQAKANSKSNLRNSPTFNHYGDSFRAKENLTSDSILNKRTAFGRKDIGMSDKNMNLVIKQAQENATQKTKNDLAEKAEKEESSKDNLRKTGVFVGGDFNSTGIKKIGSAVGDNWKSALPDSSVGTGEKTKKTFGRMFGVSSSDARVKKDLLIKMGKAIEAGKRDDPSLKGWSEEELKYVLNNPEKKHGILGGIGNALGGQYAKKWKNN